MSESANIQIHTQRRLSTVCVSQGHGVEQVLLAMRYVNSAHRWSRPLRRCFATAVGSEANRPPQTVIEKVVQKYAVGLAPGKAVRAGDYVMIQPEHVMTHDNTGPVISK